MNEKKSRAAKPVLVAATVATILWVSAGDLNPPAGPIAATQRTPIGASTTPGDADSLFMITQPGSYYLTGNITGAVDKMGIEIANHGVTLDLMGFDLLGVPGSLQGVRVSVNLLPTTNVAVINGSVRNWGSTGVDLGNVTNTRLADLRVSGNGYFGILAGRNAVVTGCALSLNDFGGIDTDVNASVTNCLANANNGSGIGTSLGCTIANCSAYENTGSGIAAGNGSTITNCSATFNRRDGIWVYGQCTARGNTCAFNGSAVGADGAGIYVGGADNRIESNNCTGNDRGIDVDAAGNLIIKNSCSGNTNNWDVVAGNVVLVVNATTAGAVSGNSGGGAPGSTDPNANFTY